MSEEQKNLQKRYEMRFAATREYRNAVWKTLCSEFFSRLIGAQATVLDIGAGWGEFINNIAAGRKYAIDLNPDTGQRLASGVTFLHQDCSTRWALESDSLDVVFTSNFLEHLQGKEKIELAVAEAHRCLKPGGRMICMGPNIKYVSRAYWDFWDHYTPLTDTSLCELLGLTGFEVELCIPRFLPFSMSRGRIPPLFAVRFYLKTPFLWRIFGRQFLVVAHKPGPLPGAAG